ncbi:unnamed protein product [Cuscuta campestris]|uniref:Translation initiation factor IF-1, chloroplastic n=1 Tax=Cuscuta campestris TaxID=132261 RepID=A0A484KMN7_9ASTE|nr:unnamed protein product [Cuscuta campestris]
MASLTWCQAAPSATATNALSLPPPPWKAATNRLSFRRNDCENLIIARAKGRLANPQRDSSRRQENGISVRPQAAAEQKLTHEGSVTESLSNGMFRVRLDNDDVVLGYISGKIRKNFIRLLPGDRVRIEVSRYDSSKGRIVYRLRGKDPKE